MSKLLLYTVFHLNLAYSSIDEEQRPQVVERCYWPLLRLIENLGVPIGIEASGSTLEIADAIDPAWTRTLRGLVERKACEFIGSGYAQLIGPLVPADVNAANLRLGHAVYDNLLGSRPDIALVNEQAYSAGLVEHYIAAGYRAIVMEWDNPARHHPQWAPEWRYLPQRAVGTEGQSIALLWNNSIAFQKFQRFAHAEIELDDILKYIGQHRAQTVRAFSLYGNDVEIFDFRPGRYTTEAALGSQEWTRIANLFSALAQEPSTRIVFPSEALSLMESPGSGNQLHLESPEEPVPVKKQEKYNITRWAVTGRNDIGINTACYRIHKAMKHAGHCSDDDWKELCILWASDFRTHITDKRWSAYSARLACSEQRLGTAATESAPREIEVNDLQLPKHGSSLTLTRSERFIRVHCKSIDVRFNCRRGLAIESLTFPAVSARPLAGTLPHGHYDDISLGADFYTGHAILEAPGVPKVTDLEPVEPSIVQSTDAVQLVAELRTPIGKLTKTVRIVSSNACVELEYKFEWAAIPQGSLRVGHVTLFPESFEHASLFYRSHNGGSLPETHWIAGKRIEHGAAVSFLVSAARGLGMTEGVVQMGDAEKSILIEADQSSSAPIGLITFREIRNTYFYRLALSIREMDETSSRASTSEPFERTLRMRLSAGLAQSVD